MASRNRGLTNKKICFKMQVSATENGNSGKFHDQPAWLVEFQCANPIPINTEFLKLALKMKRFNRFNTTLRNVFLFGYGGHSCKRALESRGVMFGGL